MRFHASKNCHTVSLCDSHTTKIESIFFDGFSVAKWKQLTAKIVTTKERFRGADMSQREGSPVPGIELYDTIEGKRASFSI